MLGRIWRELSSQHAIQHSEHTVGLLDSEIIIFSSLYDSTFTSYHTVSFTYCYSDWDVSPAYTFVRLPEIKSQVRSAEGTVLV